MSCETFLDDFLYPQIFLKDYKNQFSGFRQEMGPSDAEGAVIKTWADR